MSRLGMHAEGLIHVQMENRVISQAEKITYYCICQASILIAIISIYYFLIILIHYFIGHMQKFAVVFLMCFIIISMAVFTAEDSGMSQSEHDSCLNSDRLLNSAALELSGGTGC